MTSFFIFTFLLSVALCYSASEPKNVRTNSNNRQPRRIEDEVLQSRMLVEVYITCIVENIGCNAQGQALRCELQFYALLF